MRELRQLTQKYKDEQPNRNKFDMDKRLHDFMAEKGIASKQHSRKPQRPPMPVSLKAVEQPD